MLVLHTQQRCRTCSQTGAFFHVFSPFGALLHEIVPINSCLGAKTVHKPCTFLLFTCPNQCTYFHLFLRPPKAPGTSATPAPTSFHNEPRHSGTHKTLILYYNGSLSFNNIYFPPHLYHIFTLRRFTYISEMHQKFKKWSFVVTRGTAPQK